MTAAERAKLPLVFFMAVGIIEELVRQLRDDGMPADTPAAAVFGAGGEDETIVRGTLSDIAAGIGHELRAMPGIFLVGEVTRHRFSREWGALAGRGVLLTCSEALQNIAAGVVGDLGGVPLRRPMIRLTPAPEAREAIRRLENYEWVILTSPSAARCLAELMQETGCDVRRVPKLMVSGDGTARELENAGLFPDAIPDGDFGAGGLIKTARSRLGRGSRVLRLRSDKAGTGLADSLRELGAEVDDVVLYRNERIHYERLPAFDAALFASASGVESFVEQYGVASLNGKMTVAVGKPTMTSLRERGAGVDVVSADATVEAAIRALAAACVQRGLLSEI